MSSPTRWGGHASGQSWSGAPCPEALPRPRKNHFRCHAVGKARIDFPSGIAPAGFLGGSFGVSGTPPTKPWRSKDSKSEIGFFRPPRCDYLGEDMRVGFRKVGSKLVFH